MAKLPMTSGPSEKNEAEPAAESSPNALCKNVMAALGRPADFLRITVRRVSSENYRVNVVAGPDISAARIVNSFFITADESGTITSASPKIVKQYP